ncbi:MAG: YcjX family protein [Pirellulales bacterium]
MLHNLVARWLDPRKFPKSRTSHVRLAVTGCSRAGKTVFLTSLINHLLWHKPERFRLGPKSNLPRIVKAAERRPRKLLWRTFSYPIYREGLAAKHPTWPEKTTDCSQYTLAFESDDSFLTRYRLMNYHAWRSRNRKPEEELNRFPLAPGQPVLDYVEPIQSTAFAVRRFRTRTEGSGADQ